MGFPFISLRDWIDHLGSQGLLAENDQRMRLRNDISALSKQIADKGGPAVLHTDVEGHPGWRLLHDSLTDKHKQAIALGIDDKSFVREFAHKLAQGPGMPPVVVDKAPCQEEIFTGDAIDLTMLPLPMTTEFENPPYITSGIQLEKDPASPWVNMAIRRMHLKSPNSFCGLYSPLTHGGIIYKRYMEQGKEMPASVVIGVDPVYFMLSQLPAGPGESEASYWSTITGEPLQVVKCLTNDLYVPAHAEIVIEGKIDLTTRVFEGPFSEFPGYFSGCYRLPLFRATAVTMRTDPIYYYLYQGREPGEGHQISRSMREATTFSVVQKAVPELADVAVLSSGSFTTAMAIRKGSNRPGLVRHLAEVAKGHHLGRLIKNLFVCEDDLDIHNSTEIMWALSSRFQGERDILLINDQPGCYLDPSAPSLGRGQSTKTACYIFDCTEALPPYDEPYTRGTAIPKMTPAAKAAYDRILS